MKSWKQCFSNFFRPWPLSTSFSSCGLLSYKLAPSLMLWTSLMWFLPYGSQLRNAVFQNVFWNELVAFVSIEDLLRMLSCCLIFLVFWYAFFPELKMFFGRPVARDEVFRECFQLSLGVSLESVGLFLEILRKIWGLNQGRSHARPISWFLWSLWPC